MLNDINLAARYSDRLALMRDGRLMAIGQTGAMLTPDLLRDTFDIEVTLMQTPVGMQICPLSATSLPGPPSSPDGLPDGFSDASPNDSPNDSPDDPIAIAATRDP